MSQQDILGLDPSEDLPRLYDEQNGTVRTKDDSSTKTAVASMSEVTGSSMKKPSSGVATANMTQKGVFNISYHYMAVTLADYKGTLIEFSCILERSLF